MAYTASPKVNTPGLCPIYQLARLKVGLSRTDAVGSLVSAPFGQPSTSHQPKLDFSVKYQDVNPASLQYVQHI